MTDAPKTIWVDLDPEYDSLVVYPEPHCDLSGTEGYAHYTLTERVEAEKHQARNEAFELAAEAAEEWLRTGTLVLRAGEMSMQEIRTAHAVAGGIVRAIRAMKEEQ